MPQRPALKPGKRTQCLAFLQLFLAYWSTVLTRQDLFAQIKTEPRSDSSQLSGCHVDRRVHPSCSEEQQLHRCIKASQQFPDSMLNKRSLSFLLSTDPRQNPVQASRLLAAVIAKNAVGSSWRKTLGTREWSRVPPDEKAGVRAAALRLLFSETSDRVATQLGLLITNIARCSLAEGSRLACQCDIGCTPDHMQGKS